MIGQHFRLARRKLREALLNRTRGALMPLAPARQQQTVVGGVAQQRVLETEPPLQTAPFRQQDSGRDQIRQRRLQRCAAARHDRIENRKWKLPADHGGDLSHLARRAEAVEARHQRILERRRHRRRRLAGRLHHAPGQFLGEQRNAVSLVEDRGDGFRGQVLRCGDAGDKPGAVGAAEATERQQSRMRPRLPRRRKIRPRGHHRQQSRPADAVGKLRHQFERGGIDPVRIFQDQQNRLGFTEADDLVDQKRNGGRLALRRRQRRQRRESIRRDRQQLRQERQRRRIRRHALWERGAQLLDPDGCGVRGRKVGGAGQMFDDREQRAVAVIGRTLQVDARMRLARQCRAQRLDRARLADAGLADHRDDLALAAARQTPAVEHQSHFMGAADHRQIAAGAAGGETALHHRFADHAPDWHRAGKSLQLVLAGRFELEQSAQQVLRRLADQDRIGRGERLQPCREIWRFADDGALPRGATADDLADHDEAGGDADARLNPRAVGQFDAGDFGQDIDRGANCPLRRVLEGARKAEIGEDAVAHEFGDEATEPSDRAGHGVLIAADQRAQKLGIDRAGQRRGADHVAEQHRDLAPLGVTRSIGNLGVRQRRFGDTSLGDRLQ